MRKLSQKGICTHYLTDKLANGAVPFTTIKADVKEQGMSMTAMRRAANDMDVVSIAQVGEFGRVTFWCLPALLTDEQNLIAE